MRSRNKPSVAWARSGRRRAALALALVLMGAPGLARAAAVGFHMTLLWPGPDPWAKRYVLEVAKPGDAARVAEHLRALAGVRAVDLGPGGRALTLTLEDGARLSETALRRAARDAGARLRDLRPARQRRE